MCLRSGNETFTASVCCLQRTDARFPNPQHQMTLTQVLHRLELNLDPLLGRLPVRVSRAYARQLQLSVPWTALATQPIQVTQQTLSHSVCAQFV